MIPEAEMQPRVRALRVKLLELEARRDHYKRLIRWLMGQVR